MINRVCRDEGIPLINIVRRPEQVQILKDLGAEHILNSSDEGFLDTLQELTKKLRATVCFEAIAGSMTG